MALALIASHLCVDCNEEHDFLVNGRCAGCSPDTSWWLDEVRATMNGPDDWGDT